MSKKKRDRDPYKSLGVATFDEIAKELNMTRRGVEYIYQRALAKLRQSPQAQALKDCQP